MQCKSTSVLYLPSARQWARFCSKDMLLPPIAAGHVFNVSVISLWFNIFKIKVAKIGMVL